MGNQASSTVNNVVKKVETGVKSVIPKPTPAPAPAPPPPPPVPVCDANCQKQKKLDTLKAALDSATLTKNSEPEKYQQARIAYYTELNGPGWFQEERKRISDEKVAPAVLQITSSYKELKDQANNQKALLNLVDIINAEQKQNQEEIKYVTNQTAKNMDQANVLNRMGVLTQQEHFSMPEFNLELWLQVVIGILSLMIIVSIYRKVTSVAVMPIGGKRVPLQLTR